MLISEAIAFLDGARNDEATFNRNSVKPRLQLLEEVLKNEATLTPVRATDKVVLDAILTAGEKFNEVGNPDWIKRIAWNSKLLIRTDTECLIEKFRIYPSRPDVRVVKHIQMAGVHFDSPNWTLSETGQGEDPLLVILKAILEELGIDLFSNVLTCLNPGAPMIDTHVSTVYHRVVTQNFTTCYEWVISQRFGDDIIVRKDHSGPEAATLYLEWESYNVHVAQTN